MQQPPQKINKDLILREKLAIERTIMANDRTLLSFVRTALYFIVAGFTLQEFFSLRFGNLFPVLSFIAGGLLLLIGIYKYIALLRKIRISRRHIGNYILNWEE